MFDQPDFPGRLARALHENARFAAETRWFDGAILLEAEAGRCWLKVYCGRVLDATAEVPPFGYTFKLAGSDAAWRLLVTQERRFADLITGGSRHFADAAEVAAASNSVPAALRIEGNLLEASRMHESLYHLADSVIEAALGAEEGRR